MVRIVEVHVVEHIERLGAELNCASFSDLRVLYQAQIGGKVPRAAQDVLARVSERSDGVGREKSGVEPLLNELAVTPTGTQLRLMNACAREIGAILVVPAE